MKIIGICGKPANFSAAPAVSEAHLEMALASRIFRDWAKGLDPSFAVTAITVQAVDFRGHVPSAETVMFMRFLAKTGKPLDDIVELRGGTAVMLPVFICNGRKYTVLVRQPRIAAGNPGFVEVPAGMIDGGAFAGAASRELKEELDVVFAESELVDIGGPIYLTCGLLDECAKFFLAEREVSEDELARLQGKATGQAEEGESIVLWVVPLEEMLASAPQDGKAHIAWTLYSRYLAGRNA